MTLLTGSTGFLGKIILKYYNHIDIKTLSRSNSDYQIDLSKNIPKFIHKFNKIIHSAGLAHVNLKSTLDNNLFNKTNVDGTKNLLLGLEKSFIPEHFIFISSVAVYGISKGKNVSEDAPLLATDPYGLSKIKAEDLIIKWCKKHNVVCTIIRLPLIIGSNPPGNLRDIIKSIQNGYYFNIKNNISKRSMVLADDIGVFLKNIPKINGVFNLTDGYNPSIQELTILISNQIMVSKPFTLPLFYFKVLAYIGDNFFIRFPFNSSKLEKLTNTLTFDDSKAREILKWKPNQVLKSYNFNNIN